MIALIHRRCGAVAFYYDHMPTSDERLKAEGATTVTGERLESYMNPMCGHCFETVGMSKRYLAAIDLAEFLNAGG